MVYYVRIKGLTQKVMAERVVKTINELEGKGGVIVAVTQYADSYSWGRNKSGVIYYRADAPLMEGVVGDPR